MSKQNLSKSKLLKLKEWLTVPEAARHLSNLFEEKVTEADVLRLALDIHLTLSVDFVNHAYVRRGKFVSEEDTVWEEFPMSPAHEKVIREGSPEHAIILDEAKTKIEKYMKSLMIDDKRFINLDDKVTIVEGIWDLAMIGNERLDIEHRYQMLTGGPEITLIGLDGAFVGKEDGQICQLQESFDQNEYQTSSSAHLEKLKEHLAINNIGGEQAKEILAQHKKHREEYLSKRKKKDSSNDYYHAGGLPRDSVLVVRTQALIDLQERLSHEDSNKDTSLDSRAELTYLNIIGAMLETFIHHRHGEIDFTSEAKLREFFSKKYTGFKGLTERTLAEKFAAAKKTINEE